MGDMFQILLAIILAAIAYWVCLLLGLPVAIGIVAAILILVGTLGGLPRRL